MISFLGVCVCVNYRFRSINNVAVVLFPQICGWYEVSKYHLYSGIQAGSPNCDFKHEE